MSDSLEELISLLRVERLEQNLFRGSNGDIGSRNVFGGQVLGQALMAAAMTVEDRAIHSLHAYFLRAGDKSAKIVYDVERVRDGGSFSTRRVVAIQHGQPIFNFAASFQQIESGVEHASSMPDVPGPEGLASEIELMRGVLDRLPASRKDALLRGRPIEIRPLQPIDPIKPTVQEPRSDAWMRAVGPLPDDPVLHQAMLAYASDFGLLRSAMLPHGLSFFQPQMQVASLDHAMWFHRDFRMDQWLLYATDSPSASRARGFCRGSVYARDGTLVASVVQEGLIRQRAAASSRAPAA